MKRHSWPRRAASIILLIGVLGIAHKAWAQQGGQSAPPASPVNPVASPPASPTNPPGESHPSKDSDGTRKHLLPTTESPQNDRILWALPNYLTVENASSAPALTIKQKFKLTAEDDLDPVEFGFVGLAAGVNQVTNAYPTFGQGFKGYGKRYALELADNTVENFTVEAILPSVLHQDPRYYQMAKGGFFRRLAYSASRVALTSSDSGNTQFNYSEIFGAAVSATISDAYHPGPRTVGTTLDVWATQVAWDAAGFEMKEFWPDLHRFVQHRRHAHRASDEN